MVTASILDEVLGAALVLPENREALALNRHTPRDVVLVLVKDPSRRVRHWALSSMRLTLDDYVDLAAAPLEDVRDDAVRALDVRLWRKNIVVDETDEATCADYELSPNPVRRMIAAAATADPDRLARLARDPVRAVGAAAVANEHAPVEAVVYGVIEYESIEAGRHQNLTSSAIDHLAAMSERHQTIAYAPNMSTATLRRLAQSPDGNVVAAIARRADAPADVLEALCGHSSHEVVRGAAANPALAPRIEAMLSAGATWPVLAGFAANTAAPSAVYDEVLHSTNARVVAAAIENPACPLGVRHELLTSSLISAGDLYGALHTGGPFDWTPPDFRQPKVPVGAETLGRLVDSDDPQRRRLAARCWALSARQNHTLAADADPDVRLGIAFRYDTDPDDLADLAEAGDRELLEVVLGNVATPAATQDAAAASGDGRLRYLVSQYASLSDDAAARLLADPGSRECCNVLTAHGLVAAVSEPLLVGAATTSSGLDIG